MGHLTHWGVPEKTADLQRLVNRGKPFAPGESGNPAGRPKGALNKTTVAYRDMLAVDGKAVIERCIRDAKKGKPIALRLVLERLLPPARSTAALLDVPSITKAADVAEAASEVIRSAARGDLTLGEAREWMGLINAQRVAIETRDLAVRLEVLEEASRERRRVI